MRGGALPPALLCAALAFALALAPRRALLPGLAILVVGAVAASLLPLEGVDPDYVFAGCWISVILTAAAVHLPRGVGAKLALGLAANAGLWAGAVVAAAGMTRDLLPALPVVLLTLPAAWLVTHRGALAIKVVSSWLVAVAILAAALPMVETPGYAQDHMQ